MKVTNQNTAESTDQFDHVTLMNQYEAIQEYINSNEMNQSDIPPVAIVTMLTAVQDATRLP